jgi:hypothetical protein
MLMDNSDKRQCPKYSKNSRCIPRCGAPSGRCDELHTNRWCILKVGCDD